MPSGVTRCTSMASTKNKKIKQKMIDFACKTFSIDEVMKCSLGLTKSDFRLLKFFFDNPEKQFTTTELSEELKLNLSTIQRSVKKLKEKEVIARGQHNLQGGGYEYFYELCHKKKIVKIINNIIEEWVKRVKEELGKI